MNKVSILQNFVPYMHNVVEEIPTKILDEMKKIVYYKPQGRPPYSQEVLRFALLLRYTSRQAYSLLLDEFPLPSFSLLKKLSSGGIDSIKAIQLLLKEGKISADCVLMLDEMYLQKSSEYHGGGIIGQDEKAEFYNGILAFMIAGSKESIPYVIKAIPKTIIDGEMVMKEIEENLRVLKATAVKLLNIHYAGSSVFLYARNMINGVFLKITV